MFTVLDEPERLLTRTEWSEWTYVQSFARLLWDQGVAMALLGEPDNQGSAAQSAILSLVQHCFDAGESLYVGYKTCRSAALLSYSAWEVCGFSFIEGYCWERHKQDQGLSFISDALTAKCRSIRHTQLESQSGDSTKKWNDHTAPTARNFTSCLAI